MKVTVLLAALLAAVSFDVASAGFLFKSEKQQENAKNDEAPVKAEDAEFWSRFLEGDSSLSITESPSLAPSSSPSASPTSAPSSAPSSSPTSAPSASPTSAPSSSPSSSPTSAPSASPTSAPSSSPTSAPSSTPTSAPSSTPTSAPSAAPSSSPSSSPTAAPSSSPSSSPTSAPSSSPSSSPTAAPSSSPSSSPTSAPSASPSSAPSASPSSAPSPGPTPEPTPEPTASPTNVPPQCFLESACENRNPGANSTNCNEIPPIFIRCEARPQSMIWRYVGGDCDNSFNLQPPNQFQCEDFNGGPPEQQGTLSWIVAQERGGGDLFFNGPVAVREQWTLSAAPDRVSANMDILVYDNDPTAGGILLQQVTYHSSCSQALFLKDSFGANQLLSFTDEEGNTETLALNVTYVYDLTVVQGEGDRVSSLVSLTTPFGVLNFTDEVQDEIIGPDSMFRFEADVTLDMGERREYTSLTFASVQDRFTEEIVQCDPTTGSFFQFTAGNPDFSPTPAPTLSPTATPQPTPDPETNACEVDALVNCRILGGPTYLPCNSTRAPTLASCIDGLNRPDTANVPFSISFLYDGSTTGGRETVFIEVDNSRFLNFKGVVDLNEIWSPYGLDGRRTSLTVTLYTEDPEDGGVELESFDMNVECGANTDVVLGRQFLSNELVGFQISATNQFSKAQLGLFYDVENVGPFNAEVRTVMVQNLGPNSESFPLPLSVPKRETRTAIREQVILELTTGNSINRGLMVNAVNDDSTSMLGCSSQTTETIFVN